MKRNPVIPYAIIGILGIVAMIILAGVGVSQMDEVKGGDTEQGVEEEGGGGESVAAGPEEIYQNNCSMCHGADLAGGAGPALDTIGSTLSSEDILSVIQNGQGIMQPNIIVGEEAQAVADWLAEHK